MKKLFSMKGTADIVEWWVTSSIANVIAQIAAAFGALYWLSKDWSEKAAGAFLISIAAISIWISLAVTVRRLRDRKRPVWALALGLIPVAGWLWLLIECGFLPAPNQGAKRGVIKKTITQSPPVDAGSRTLDA